MSKLKKTFTREVIYKINEPVEFSWLGETRSGVIERIESESREFPIYFVRAYQTGRLYNMGADPGVTSAGFVIGKASKTKPKKVVIEDITPEIQPEEKTELKKAVKKQKDFINHFFDIE